MPSTSVHFGVSTTDRDALYDSVPLDSLANQTRFLRLLPGQEGSIIRGELFAASLESNPEYEALSYAWGNPGATRVISVNNHSLSISNGLHLALQAIRRGFCTTSTITLWVDAICINQCDNQEKNTQVPLMSEIYTNTLRVIVWLGDADAFDGLAMTVMKDAITRRGLGEALTEERDGRALKIQWYLESLPTGSSLGDLLKGVAALALRPWFRRTWILQELCLSSAVPLVLCGDFSLCWSCFGLGFGHLKLLFGLHERYTCPGFLAEPDDPRLRLAQDHIEQFTVLHHFNDLMYINDLRTRVQAREHETDIPLETTLWETTHTLATDPRDKVYGLLALAPAAARKQIIVDYDTNNLAGVYTQAVRYMFSTTGFGILSCAGIIDGSHDPAWPSWLPRFDRSLQDLSRPISLTRSIFQRRAIYKASHHLPNFHLFLGRKRLVLYGLPVDKVSRIGVKTSLKSMDHFACLSVLRHAAKLCGRCHACQSAPQGSEWRGRKPECIDPELWALGQCREPLYAPCIPSESPITTRAATAGYIHVQHRQNPASDMDSSSWIKEDSNGAPNHGIVPWGYTHRKLFRDIIWRVFVGDYLTAADPKKDMLTSGQIPAPPQAMVRVLEVLWRRTKRGSDVILRDIPGRSSPTSFAEDAERDTGYSGFGRAVEKTVVTWSMGRTCNGRCPFVTTGGWLGFGPSAMEAGDVVVVFAGADLPFVIRPHGEGDEFVLIGEAYVHGLMVGELFEQCPAFNGEDAGYKIRLQRFCLR
jgi:hypothetical protein